MSSAWCKICSALSYETTNDIDITEALWIHALIHLWTQVRVLSIVSCTWLTYVILFVCIGYHSLDEWNSYFDQMSVMFGIL